jgi:hypothetical protein
MTPLPPTAAASVDARSSTGRIVAIVLAGIAFLMLWSLIPTFIVPLILVTHVLIFERLFRKPGSSSRT